MQILLWQVPSKKYVLGDIPFQSDATANKERFDIGISDRMDNVGESALKFN